METLNKTEAKALLESIRASKTGRIFKVVFEKRTNNELRSMVCRFGVRKHVKGVGRRFDPKNLHLMGVYDVQKREYRMISLERVREIVVDGVASRVR